jgi:DNA-binding CsgD family transcriptional regulator
MELTHDFPLSGSVQDMIAQVTEAMDVDFGTLHLFRGGHDATNRPFVRTTYPDAWVSQYLLNDYVRIDPVLQHALTHPDPFCWSTLELNAQQKQMMQNAIAAGVGQTGFTVSHVDEIGRRSMLSMNAKRAVGGETWQPYLTENHAVLLALVADLHAASLAELHEHTGDLPQLSPRERECLKWAAEGKAHTDIAIILDLSEHTVRGYLKVVRTKLDSVTMAQAVAKATSMGLI